MPPFTRKRNFGDGVQQGTVQSAPTSPVDPPVTAQPDVQRRRLNGTFAAPVRRLLMRRKGRL